MKLWIKLIVGVFLGIIVGSYVDPGSVFVEVLRVAGLLFIRVLSFMILPLMLLSGVKSVIFMRKRKVLVVSAFKAIGYFLLFTAVGATIGVILGNLLQPGLGINIGEIESPQKILYPGTSDFILSIVPESVADFFTSWYGALSIIFIAYIIGAGIIHAKGDSEVFFGFIESFDETMHKINIMVLDFFAIGVFAYSGYLMATTSADMIYPYLKLILVIIGGLAILIFIIIGPSLYFLTKLNPFIFIHAILPACITGFITGDRYKSYSVIVECMEHNLGARPEATTLINALGVTFSLGGSAVVAGVCTLFVSQAYGLSLSVYLQIIVVFIIVVASLKIDRLREGSLVILSVVFSKIVKLPDEGFALVLGVSLLLERIETIANIVINAAVSYIISKSNDSVETISIRDFL